MGTSARNDGNDHPDIALAATMATLRRLAPGGGEVPIRTPLLEDECHWFNRAVSDGIVEFTRCPDECFRTKKWGVPGPDHFVTPAGKPRHLFSTPNSPTPWLNREYIPHIAAYARAILNMGYDPGASSFSLYRSFSRDLVTKQAGGGYETDAEFYESSGSIHLQIEAKAQPAQVRRLASLITEIRTLRALPPKLIKEIEYVLDLSPRYLWLVGPGSIDPAAHVYSCTVDGLDVTFEPLTDLPPPPRS